MPDKFKNYSPHYFPLLDLFWSLIYLGMVSKTSKEKHHKLMTEKVYIKPALQSFEDYI